ncbi:hypothetical protein [Sorangium sp. So ce1099]|uniref:hypothetical protein n=1 Tax=Sorangium sp. So ce1099 TaxID=3133331 RepID=UPI003F61D46C
MHAARAAHTASAAPAADAGSGIGVDVSVEADAAKQRFAPAPGNLVGARVS